MIWLYGYLAGFAVAFFACWAMLGLGTKIGTWRDAIFLAWFWPGAAVIGVLFLPFWLASLVMKLMRPKVNRNPMTAS